MTPTPGTVTINCEEFCLAPLACVASFKLMSNAQEIETAFRQLSREEQDALLARLADIWENSLELSDEFKSKLARADEDIAAGRVRVRHSGN